MSKLLPSRHLAAGLVLRADEVQPVHRELLAAELFAVHQRVLVDYGHQAEVAEWKDATAEERAPWGTLAESILSRMMRELDRNGDA